MQLLLTTIFFTARDEKRYTPRHSPLSALFHYHEPHYRSDLTVSDSITSPRSNIKSYRLLRNPRFPVTQLAPFSPDGCQHLTAIYRSVGLHGTAYGIDAEAGENGEKRRRNRRRRNTNAPRRRRAPRPPPTPEINAYS